MQGCSQRRHGSLGAAFVFYFVCDCCCCKYEAIEVVSLQSFSLSRASQNAVLDGWKCLLSNFLMQHQIQIPDPDSHVLPCPNAKPDVSQSF
jgi:hypothetical protein